MVSVIPVFVDRIESDHDARHGTNPDRESSETPETQYCILSVMTRTAGTEWNKNG